MIFWLATAALAGTTSVARFEPDPLAGHPVLDLRLGVAAAEPLGHPYVCLQGAPLARLALEACGTGSGFLHHGAEPEIAHFRARATLWGLAAGRGDAGLVAGFGFAEVQRGEDASGFQFGPARSSDQTSGAGPEASLSAVGRWWLHERAYAIADVNAGAAHVPAAPTVLGHGGPVVPFLLVTAGLGF